MYPTVCWGWAYVQKHRWPSTWTSWGYSNCQPAHPCIIRRRAWGSPAVISRSCEGSKEYPRGRQPWGAWRNANAAANSKVKLFLFHTILYSLQHLPGASKNWWLLFPFWWSASTVWAVGMEPSSLVVPIRRQMAILTHAGKIIPPGPSQLLTLSKYL